MEDPLGVRPCNEESIKAIAAKIMKMCRDERFYELPIEDIAKVLKHAEPLNFPVAEHIVKETVKKYNKKAIKILPYMKFDENVSGVQIEYLFGSIPNIPTFGLLTRLNQLPEEDTLTNIQKEVEEKRQTLKSIKNASIFFENFQHNALEAKDKKNHE